MVTQSESQMQAYSTAVSTSPSAVTSTTAVAAGLAAGPGSSTLSAATTVGATSLTVASATSFFVGELVLIGGGTALAEIAQITAIVTTTFTVQGYQGGGLTVAHASGATIKGMYAGIQPSQTGRLKITVTGSLLAGATAATCTAQIYIGSAITVAAPANAAAFDASAVAVGQTQTWVSLTGSLETVYSQTVYLGANAAATDTAPSGGASRTVGTPYYIDVGLTASTSTIQLVKPSIVVEEL